MISMAVNGSSYAERPLPRPASTSLGFLLLVMVWAGCKGEEARPAEPAPRPSASPDPRELRGEARGRRMLAEARHCLIGPRVERAHACRLACDLAHSNSCYYYGRHLEQGDGVPRDLGAALARYSEGCTGGSGLACRAAGHMYARGVGVTADMARANAIYANGRRYGRVHCEQNHAASCLGIGEMFAAGEGGAVDRRTAAHFLRKGCVLKLDAACRALEHLR